MPTLEEIASLANVSRSTVSRVINNDPNVNETTRKRVQDVIREVNFHPNLAARNLAGGRTRIIGFVIPMGVSTLFTDPFFSLLIQGVSSACNASDYSVMLWLAEPEYERRTIHQILNNNLVDGILIASMVLDDPLIKASIESGRPFITVGRNPTSQNISYVDVDNQKSAQEIVSYLLRLGYRRVATITGPQNLIAGADRMEGYRAALRQWGLPYDPDLVAQSDFTEEGAYLCMQRLIPRRPQAVFCASDAMALGALRAAKESGLRIPEELAVCGFDDMPFSARTDPPLTTVRQPVFREGVVAAETLIDMIEHPHNLQPHRILLPTELVIRSSCGSGRE